LYLLLAIAAAIQVYFLSVKTVPGQPPPPNKFNNYLIFKASFSHLIEGKNLYQ
jgi:hypothetical protein